MIEKTLMHQKTEILREKIELASSRFKGPHLTDGKIDVIAVSKFHPVEAILAAQTLGFSHFGENRVQELTEKRADPRLENCSFDLIGSLQTNKVKHVVGEVRLIHSLDRASLSAALQKRARQLDIVQDVLIQINYSNESSKHGINQGELTVLLDSLAHCPNLRLRGLMTMAAPYLSVQEQDAFFQGFRELFDQTKEQLPADFERRFFNILSMGMTNDFEAALAAGSNCIRMGRAIFGERL